MAAAIDGAAAILRTRGVNLGLLAIKVREPGGFKEGLVV